MKCLCFVTPNEVVKAFTLIQQQATPNFKPILDYFETYYIGNLKKRTVRVYESSLHFRSNAGAYISACWKAAEELMPRSKHGITLLD